MKLQATTDNYDAFVEFQTVDNNAFIGLDDSLNLLKINNDAGIGAYNHLVIDTSGNVGIGTSSPDSKLHIFNSDASITASVDADDLIVENNGACGITIGSATNSTGSIRFADSGGTHLGMLYYSHITNEMRLYTSSTQRMSIDSSGAVEIGTYGGTGATRGFIVDPSVNSNGYRIRSSVTTSSNLAHYQFANTNGIVGAIRTNGTATAYDTSSDYRLKENVTADWDATTRLKQLNPVRFNFIADADTTVDGFLAHEVQSVVPEAISGTHNEVEVWQDGEELPDGVSVGDNKLDEDGNTIPVYQGIDQSKLVPLLVKTIQELEARITALETA
jgi:hypothetical protein